MDDLNITFRDEQPQSLDIAFRDAPAQPTYAQGWKQAWEAGYQGSIPGLVDRGKLPDVVLDPHNARWYEKLAASAAQMLHETPEMLAGAGTGAATGGAIGGAVGTVALPVVGTVSGATVGGVIGAGSGAMAVPTAIRQSLIEAYSKGKVKDAADFLDRTKIVLSYTGKDALIGAATSIAGPVAGKAVAPTLEGAVAAGRISAGTARFATDAAVTGAELGTMFVTPALLDGHLPQATDIFNAAVLTVGLKGSIKAVDVASQRIGQTYAQTGVRPEQVVADAKTDPTIAADLVAGAEPPVTEYVDTRGDKYRFHGTVRAIDSLSDDYALSGDSRNIYGQGFYTTDALDIARGYAKKGGKNGVVYEVNHQPVKLFDMEAPLTPEIAAMIQKTMGDYFPTENAETGKPLNNLREIYDEYRARSKDEGITRDEVQEVFDSIRENLEQQGYRGFDHVGGLRTNNPAHSVKIFWFPEQDVSVRFADLTKHEKPFDVAEPTAHSDIPRAYQGLAAKVAAQDALPDPSILKDLLTPGKVPAEKSKGQLNWDYINGPDDVRALAARAEELNDAQVAAAGGKDTRSWAEARQQSDQQMQALAGPDFDRVMKEGRGPNGTLNDKQIHILNVLYEDAVNTLNAKVEAWKASPTPENELAALQAVHRYQLVHAERVGAASELGRALNFLKATVNLAREGAEKSRIMELYQGDPATMLQALGMADNRTGLATMARRSTPDTFVNRQSELYRAALMSGLMSSGANIFGNTAMLIRAPLVDLAAATGGLILRQEGRATYSEAVARASGYVMGAVSMLKAGADIVKADGIWAGGKNVVKSAWEAGQALMPENSVTLNTGIRGEFVKAVYGTNSMLDAMFRVLGEHGEIYSAAAREAINEGYTPGTRDFFTTMRSAVEDPSAKTIDAAEAAGKRVSFQGGSGKAIQNLYKFLDTNEGTRLLKFFAVPFLGTPSKMFEEMARHSVFAPAVSAWRKDIAAGGATAARAYAEVTVGTALMGTAMMMVDSGLITGYGPPEPDKRKAWLTEYQPYSKKNAKGEWVDYSRIAVFGPLIGMAADLREMSKYMNPEEQYRVSKMAIITFKNAVANQTMLQGITTLMDSFKDDRGFDYWAQQFAGSWVPGILGQTAASLDPYRREVNGVLDAVRNRVPLVRETLIPQRDFLGKEVAETRNGNIISPIRVMQGTDEKVYTEAARLASIGYFGVSATPKSIKLQDMGVPQLGKVDLTPEQRDVFASESGKMAKMVLDPMVNAPTWNSIPDVMKGLIYRSVLSNAHEYGRMQALPPDQLAKEITRIQKTLGEKLSP